MEQNFAFCEWEPYVVKTNSVFNKLRIYTNTSFVFPLSKKSYDFSEALIMPQAKGEKRQAPQELNVTAVLKYTLFRSGSSGVRVSGGHLCEAEAPTEPTGETADPYNNIFKFGVVQPTLSKVCEQNQPMGSIIQFYNRGYNIISLLSFLFASLKILIYFNTTGKDCQTAELLFILLNKINIEKICNSVIIGECRNVYFNVLRSGSFSLRDALYGRTVKIIFRRQTAKAIRQNDRQNLQRRSAWLRHNGTYSVIIGSNGDDCWICKFKNDDAFTGNCRNYGRKYRHNNNCVDTFADGNQFGQYIYKYAQAVIFCTDYCNYRRIYFYVFQKGKTAEYRRNYGWVFCFNDGYDLYEQRYEFFS